MKTTEYTSETSDVFLHLCRETNSEFFSSLANIDISWWYLYHKQTSIALRTLTLSIFFNKVDTQLLPKRINCIEYVSQSLNLSLPSRTFVTAFGLDFYFVWFYVCWTSLIEHGSLCCLLLCVWFCIKICHIPPTYNIGAFLNVILLRAILLLNSMSV